MITVILCIAIAVIVLLFLMRMNIHSVSSKQNHSNGKLEQNSTVKEKTESTSKIFDEVSTAIEIEASHGSNQAPKMDDQVYRQALQQLQDLKQQDTKEQTKKMSDERYREMLRAFRKKDKG
ncbi:hypothetical protein WQ54_19230 [Bacillus sp. SA1-12]|uniref:hypothetical protein n=1 Tax=Bacillus sp. SA1-12 TaxID=1455638 RepID=UPI000627169F|nr:hypothetical protein [Bacillus sp. SA1-12]KKI90736.1 hypothetical protein WQ54_19230 [Bacillus sp. SA1-12]